MSLLIRIIFAVGFAFGVHASPPTFDESASPFGALYKTGDGRDFIQCRSIEPRNACGSVGYGPNVIFFDCSDANFKCVMNTIDVFAVPRAGISLGQSYELLGAKLNVERCFGDQKSCQIAVISTNCIDAPGCKCQHHDSVRTVFYYRREAGIVAFYSYAADGILGTDTQLLIAGLPIITYVLMEDRGFLSAPLELPRAKANAKCETPK